MTDNLRAQFTEVLAGAANSQRTWQGVLDCGLLADAVIAELGLRRQTNADICLAATKHRYVTRWEDGA